MVLEVCLVIQHLNDGTKQSGAKHLFSGVLNFHLLLWLAMPVE